jgi:hypothetical protein
MVLSSLTDHALSLLPIISSKTSRYNAGRVEDFLTKFAQTYSRRGERKFLLPHPHYRVIPKHA